MTRFFAAGFLEDSDDVAVVNPMACIPKEELDKHRIITDCRASGVNDYITKTPPVSLPAAADVFACLYASGHMVETDFKDHFYHFMVSEKDRKYLGVRRPHGGKVQRYTRPPMGVKTSPHICCSTTAAWEDELVKQPPFCGILTANLPAQPEYDPALPYLYRKDASGKIAASTAVYVDDCLANARDRAQGMKAIRRIVSYGGSWGFLCKYSKLKGPRQSNRTFHGFELDTREHKGGPRARLRPKPRAAAKLLVATALACGASINRRLLAQVVGKLLSLAPAVPHGVTFLRRLWDSLHALQLSPDQRPGRRYDVMVPLDREHRRDLDWWHVALKDTTGTYLMRNKDVRLRVHYTDGSGYGTGGCGYEFTTAKLPEVSYFSGLWKQEVTSMSSNWKELRTILNALRRERLTAQHEQRRTSLWRTRIFHMTDNLVSECILTKGASHSPRLQQLLREIALELRLQQCDLVPIHVAGTRLIAQGTDGLSRGQMHAGIMDGNVEDVNAFNPLAQQPRPITQPLREWVKRYGHGTELWDPVTWEPQNIRGKHTIWMPPPLLARDALLIFLRQRMIAPTTTTATFLLPRRFTAPWRRLIRKFDITVVKAGNGDHWKATEFEPLIVAHCPPWSPSLQVRTSERRSRGRLGAARTTTLTRSNAAGAETTSNYTRHYDASTASSPSRRLVTIKQARFLRA